MATEAHWKTTVAWVTEQRSVDAKHSWVSRTTDEINATRQQARIPLRYTQVLWLQRNDCEQKVQHFVDARVRATCCGIAKLQILL